MPCPSRRCRWSGRSRGTVSDVGCAWDPAGRTTGTLGEAHAGCPLHRAPDTDLCRERREARPAAGRPRSALVAGQASASSRAWTHAPGLRTDSRGTPADTEQTAPLPPPQVLHTAAAPCRPQDTRLEREGVSQFPRSAQRPLRCGGEETRGIAGGQRLPPWGPLVGTALPLPQQRVFRCAGGGEGVSSGKHTPVSTSGWCP